MGTSMVLTLSDSQTVRVYFHRDGTTEVKFLQSNKVLVITGEVTIAMLEQLK